MPTTMRAPSPPPIDPLSGEAALQDAIGEVAGDHVVIVGHHTLDVMCAMIRGGADEATVLRLDERPDPHEADLAIIVGPSGPQECRAAIAQAQRALVPSGRVVVGRLAAILADQVAAQLRAHGFVDVRRHGSGEDPVLAADLPFFGALGRAHA